MQACRYQFRIHSFDSDAFGTVTAPRLLGYFLESAGCSAHALGFGIQALQEQGLTWVIGRIRIVVHAAIRVGDAIEVETWPSGIERAVAMRDFRLLKAGQQVGEATSQWFVLDMQSRLPMRPHKLLPEGFHPELEHLVPLPRVIQPLKDPALQQTEFNVRLSDIDLNQHVTAASYIDWAMQGLPEDLWRTHRLSSMDVQFLEECHLGSRILSESQLSATDTLLHRISRTSDHKELARLATTWVPR
jgi:medium-chain acyl-[acyl-carrier-protein] hydrolase